MRYLGALILFALSAVAQPFTFNDPAMQGAANWRWPVATVEYDITEDCEGTGTPSGWTDVNTPDWDYTSTVIDGTHSLQLDAGDSSYKTLSDVSDYWMYMKVRLPQLPFSATRSFGGFRGASSEAHCIFRVSSAGAVTVFCNGADSTPCVATMSANTTYHVWLHFVSGGTSTVAFSTDGTKPTSGDNFTSRTAAAVTAARFQMAAENVGIIIDKIRGDADTIGSNP